MRSGRRAAVIFAFTVLLVIALYAGRASRPGGHTQIPLAWPAAGVSVWFFYYLRDWSRVWRLIALLCLVGAVVVVNLETGIVLVPAILFALVNGTNALVGSLALVRFLPGGALREPNDVVRILGSSAIAGAVSGLGTAVIAHRWLGTEFIDSFVLTSIRNGGTTFALMVIIFSVSAPYSLRDVVARRHRARALMIGTVLAVTFACVLVFANGIPLLFLAVAASVWAGVRVDVPRAALMAGLVSVLSVWLTVAGFGGIAHLEDPETQAVVLQAFVVAVLFVTLALAALGRSREELAERVEDSLRLLRNLSNSAPVGTVMALKSAEGGWFLHEANPALVRLLGLDPEGQRWGSLVDDADKPALRAVLDDIAAGRRETWEGEVRHHTVEGDTFWTQVHISRLSGHDNTTGVIAQLSDVTVRRTAQDQLDYLAHHDALTGLPNRMHLHAELNALIASLDRKPLTAFFLDLDNFKSVNDTFGHEVGDLVLEQVGVSLQAALRPGDLVGRLGGDEFVVCCLGVSNDEAAAVGWRLEQAIAPALQMPTVADLDLGVSIGWAQYQPQDDARSLLRRSDAAMYAAKPVAPSGV